MKGLQVKVKVQILVVGNFKPNTYLIQYDEQLFTSNSTQEIY